MDGDPAAAMRYTECRLQVRHFGLQKLNNQAFVLWMKALTYSLTWGGDLEYLNLA